MRSPGREGPVLERFRPRMERLFAQIDTLAARHGAVAADLRFARQHLVPWRGRRLTGRSSGDGRPANRPELLPYES